MKKLLFILLALVFAVPAFGAGYHATGLTAADSRCSFADSYSWLEWDGLDFSAYGTGNWFIRLTDTNGLVAEGYSGSLGSGETLGGEDEVSLKQVTEPSATAIHILDGPAGSSGWAKVETGFAYNDIVEIEIVPAP